MSTPIMMTPALGQELLAAPQINPYGALQYRDPQTNAAIAITPRTAVDFSERVVLHLLNAADVVQGSQFLQPPPAPHVLGIPALRMPMEGEVLQGRRKNALLASNERGHQLTVTQRITPDRIRETIETIDTEVVVIGGRAPDNTFRRGQSVSVHYLRNTDPQGDEPKISEVSTTGHRRFALHGPEVQEWLRGKNIDFDDSEAVLGLMSAIIFGELPTEGSNKITIISAAIYSVIPSEDREPKMNTQVPVFMSDTNITLGEFNWNGYLHGRQSFVAEVTFAWGSQTLTARVRKYNAQDYPKMDMDFLTLSLGYSGFEDITPAIRGLGLVAMDQHLARLSGAGNGQPG